MAEARRITYVAVEEVGSVTIPRTPPDSWWEQHERRGILAPGIATIWYKRYSPTKRLVAWMAADDKDWDAKGMRRPQ